MVHIGLVVRCLRKSSFISPLVRQRLATESVSPSTVRHSSLKRSRYFLVDSSCFCVTPSKLMGCLALVILVVNWAMNFRVISWKLAMDPFGRALNHLIAGPARVTGKALHRTASAAPSRFILASKAVRCSWGSLVPSYFISVGLSKPLGSFALRILSVKGVAPIIIWSFLVRLVFRSLRSSSE